MDHLANSPPAPTQTLPATLFLSWRTGPGPCLAKLTWNPSFWGECVNCVDYLLRDMMIEAEQASTSSWRTPSLRPRCRARSPRCWRRCPLRRRRLRPNRTHEKGREQRSSGAVHVLAHALGDVVFTLTSVICPGRHGWHMHGLSRPLTPVGPRAVHMSSPFQLCPSPAHDRCRGIAVVQAPAKRYVARTGWRRRGAAPATALEDLVGV